MPRHGGRGRVESRRFALLVPEQLNMLKGRTKKLRWVPWLVSDPSLPVSSGIMFSPSIYKLKKKGRDWCPTR